ncbi:MAG: alpha/beta fold hydrolase, partial [Vicinamibacterales bacterium]|nr:alpha/beta fold hydrolase [Vicinamibacterales bacterium]
MSFVVTLTVLAAGLLLLVWTFQRSLIYFPFGDVPSPGEMGLPDVEAVTFPAEDGLTLAGWFVPSRVEPASGTVIVFNGNAGNRAGRAALASAMRDYGYRVLLFDYRGYGGNGGAPTEAGLGADARAARAYLLGRPDVDADQLVYFGESLGSAVAVALAAEHRPAALVLRSPFTSLVDVGRTHYPFLPVKLLLRDRFDTVDAI